MKQVPIRLGPLALLLSVISICMAMLSILAFMTARADYRLAEKYADTTQARYELEQEGQSFLSVADGALAQGTALHNLPETQTDENHTTWKTITNGNSRLVIGIAPEGENQWRIVSWKVQTDWEPEQTQGNLWTGE